MVTIVPGPTTAVKLPAGQAVGGAAGMSLGQALLPVIAAVAIGGAVYYYYKSKNQQDALSMLFDN